MGTSGVLRYSWAAVLLLACTAWEDERDLPQREVTSDVILGEKDNSKLIPDLTQKDVTYDFDGLWEPIELPETDTDVTQLNVNVNLPKRLKESGPPRFGPRSFPVPYVPFPPARPSSHNLPGLCRHGDSRPRYPPDSLPHTGFSHLRRYGDAINRMESWYSTCCQGNRTWEQNLTLCCAQQAWEEALSQFCTEEFMIKTSHYHCCKKQGQARWDCFESAAPNPSYTPTSLGAAHTSWAQEPEFNWDSKICDRAQAVTPRSSRAENTHVPEIRFPPGQPTPSNTESICGFRNLRPIYLPKCLPRTGYGWLARQAMAINRLERGIKKCCKGKVEVLPCLDGKWREVMDQFCQDEQSVKAPQFHCCELQDKAERYTCFSSEAPDKEYHNEMLQKELRPIFASVRLVCDTHKLLVKKYSLPLPVASIVAQCCHLPAAQRDSCVEAELDKLWASMCSGEDPLPQGVSPDCCRRNCLPELLMKNIRKAIKTPYFQRRRCNHF